MPRLKRRGTRRMGASFHPYYNVSGRRGTGRRFRARGAAIRARGRGRGRGERFSTRDPSTRRAMEKVRDLQQAIRKQFSTSLEHKLRHFSLVRQRDRMETSLRVCQRHRDLFQRKQQRLRTLLDSLKIWQRALRQCRVIMFEYLLQNAVDEICREPPRRDICVPLEKEYLPPEYRKTFIMCNVVLMTMIGCLAQHRFRQQRSELLDNVQNLLLKSFLKYDGVQEGDADNEERSKLSVEECFDCVFKLDCRLLRSVGSTVFLLLPLHHEFVSFSRHFVEYVSTSSVERKINSWNEDGEVLLWNSVNKRRFLLLQLLRHHSRIYIPPVKAILSPLEYMETFGKLFENVPGHSDFQKLLRERHSENEKFQTQSINTDMLFDPFASLFEEEDEVIHMSDIEEDDLEQMGETGQSSSPFDPQDSVLDNLGTYYFHPLYILDRQSFDGIIDKSRLKAFIRYIDPQSDKLDRVIRLLELPVDAILEIVNGSGSSQGTTPSNDDTSGVIEPAENSGENLLLEDKDGYQIKTEEVSEMQAPSYVNERPPEKSEIEEIHEQGHNKDEPIEEIEEDDEEFSVQTLPDLLAYLTEYERQIVYFVLQIPSSSEDTNGKLLDFLLKLAAVRYVLDGDEEKQSELLVLRLHDSSDSKEGEEEDGYDLSGREFQLSRTFDLNRNTPSPVLSRILDRIVALVDTHESLTDLDTVECQELTYLDDRVFPEALNQLEKRFRCRLHHPPVRVKIGYTIDGILSNVAVEHYRCPFIYDFDHANSALDTDETDNDVQMGENEINFTGSDFVPLTTNQKDSKGHEIKQFSKSLTKKLYEQQGSTTMSSRRYSENLIEDYLKQSTSMFRGVCQAFCRSNAPSSKALTYTDIEREEDAVWWSVGILRGVFLSTCGESIHGDAHNEVKSSLCPWSQIDREQPQELTNSLKTLANTNLRNALIGLSANGNEAPLDQVQRVKYVVNGIYSYLKKRSDISPALELFLMRIYCRNYDFFDSSEQATLHSQMCRIPTSSSPFLCWLRCLDARLWLQRDILETTESVIIEYCRCYDRDLGSHRISWRFAHLFGFLLRVVCEHRGACECLKLLEKYGWNTEAKGDYSVNVQVSTSCHFWSWYLYICIHGTCPPVELTERPGTFVKMPFPLERQDCDFTDLDCISTFQDIYGGSSEEPGGINEAIVVKSSVHLKQVFSIVTLSLINCLSDRFSECDENVAYLTAYVIKYGEVTSQNHRTLLEARNTWKLVEEYPDILFSALMRFSTYDSPEKTLLRINKSDGIGSDDNEEVYYEVLSNSRLVWWCIHNHARASNEKDFLSIAVFHLLSVGTAFEPFSSKHSTVADKCTSVRTMREYVGTPVNPEKVEIICDDFLKLWCHTDRREFNPSISVNSIRIALWTLTTLHGKRVVVGWLKRCITSTKIWMSRWSAKELLESHVSEFQNNLLSVLGELHILYISLRTSCGSSTSIERQLVQEAFRDLERWSLAVQCLVHNDNSLTIYFRARICHWLTGTPVSASSACFAGDDIYGGWNGISPEVGARLLQLHRTCLSSVDSLSDILQSFENNGELELLPLPFEWNHLSFDQQVLLSEAPQSLLGSNNFDALNAWLMRDHEFLQKHEIYSTPGVFDPTCFSALPLIHTLRTPIDSQAMMEWKQGHLPSIFSLLKQRTPNPSIFLLLLTNPGLWCLQLQICLTNLGKNGCGVERSFAHSP